MPGVPTRKIVVPNEILKRWILRDYDSMDDETHQFAAELMSLPPDATLLECRAIERSPGITLVWAHPSFPPDLTSVIVSNNEPRIPAHWDYAKPDRVKEVEDSAEHQDWVQWRKEHNV